MKKRILSLILCVGMLLSMTACGGASETEPTTVPPTTTEPAPDAAEIYNAAADKVRSAPSMLIDYTIDKTMTLGGDSYLESETTNLSLSGIGTDSFAAKATSAYTWGEDYYADTSDIFVDGVYYGKVDASAFTTEMTGEAYQSMYLPGVLLTAELYESVEMLDENTVSFSGATALEPWLAQEGYTLVEASGTAYIDATGELEDCTYHAVYTCGSIGYEIEVSFRTMTGSITVEAPADTSAYVTTEHPEAALAYERAIGLVLQAGDMTSASSETILIQAGSLTQTQSSTMNTYGFGSDLKARFETTYALTDISTGAQHYAGTQEETFLNGTYSVRVDGGSPQTDSTVTADVMHSYRQGFTANSMPLLDDMASLSPSDMGATWLLEFTYLEDVARNLSPSVVGMVYEDPNLLDDLASAYRTEAAGGYIGIDKLTGLPTALGIGYVAIHTIDGADYVLSYDYTQNFATGTAYEELTGEKLPVEAPETQATPLLYRVTGENGEEMYLFGTIHVGDERTAYLPQAILDAFTASDALAVEFDMDTFEEKMTSDPATAALIAQSYVYTDGTSILDHLEDDTLADEAVKILKSTGNYNSTLLVMKPIILAQSIENDYIRLSRTISADMGADRQLLAMAREQGKEILEVETGEAQMQMLTGYSDALQELLLAEALEYDPAEYMAETMELYELWCAGDEAALTALINEVDETLTEEEAALYEEYNKAMSTDRNAAMLAVAKGYLSGEKTVFYAVGLAHLLAEDGLVNTLRQAGYTVELVPCA